MRNRIITVFDATGAQGGGLARVALIERPDSAELANMYQYKRDFAALHCGLRSVAAIRELVPALATFGDWLAIHAQRTPVPERGQPVAEPTLKAA